MARSLASASSLRQSRPGDNPQVAQALALLRVCVQQCGWTHEALAAAMGKDRSLVTRVLDGERPMTEEFVCALPDDIERLYLQKRAEQFGAIVVQPLHGVDAQRAFVSGLMGLMAGAAAERQECPLIAGLPLVPAKVTA